MGLWYRVFAASDAEVPADAMLAHLRGLDPEAAGDFRGEGGGWLSAELRSGGPTPLYLERFLASEEGIRGELNAWAAYLETCDYSPNHRELMERTIRTRQLFTLRRPIDAADEVRVERLCVGLCRFLAASADGFWQSDDEGFFAADGTLLLQEY